VLSGKAARPLTDAQIKYLGMFRILALPRRGTAQGIFGSRKIRER
jgi:hypothetical protein